MENIMFTLYKPGKAGTANNMRIEELREKRKTKIHCPKEWTKAYKKGTENTNRTYIEEMQARAVEIIVNAGGITPLWIGVITKAWIWLMEWGGIPDNYISEYIREIRGIIYAFARESWKVRCTMVYSPEEEQKRKTKTDMHKTHESYMKRMKANNKMNITRVMHMTMQERKNLLQRMEHRNQWKQVSLKALEFFTESETNNNNEPTMTTNKRTIQTVQREADKRARKIQLNFTQFCITNTRKQSAKEKGKVKCNIH
jgi:hypothetical protein